MEHPFNYPQFLLLPFLVLLLPHFNQSQSFQMAGCCADFCQTSVNDMWKTKTTALGLEWDIELEEKPQQFPIIGRRTRKWVIDVIVIVAEEFNSPDHHNHQPAPLQAQPVLVLSGSR